MTADTDIVPVFVASLPEDRRRDAAGCAGLSRTLDAMLSAAKAAWPDIELTNDILLPYLAERLPPDDDVLEQLHQLRIGELYLACACAHGDDRAVATFDTHFANWIAATLRRMNLAQVLVEDIQQRLHQKLFVRQVDRKPDIVKYSGRGSLKSWVHITVSRMALEQLKRHNREVPTDDQLLATTPAMESDPEIGYLKHLYRKEFKVAFREAMVALSSRDRNLLRQQSLDGLGIDEIGVLYQVHRATAARWLVRAKQRLALETRNRMMAQLKIPRREYESILRLIESRMDLSVARYLRSVTRAGEG